MARQGSVLVATFHPELTDDPTVHAYFVPHGAAGARGVIFHDYYADVPADEVTRFVDGPGAGPTGDGRRRRHAAPRPLSLRARARGRSTCTWCAADELVDRSEGAPTLRVRGRRGARRDSLVLGEPGVRGLGHRVSPDGDLRVPRHASSRIPPRSPRSSCGCWRATSPRADSARSRRPIRSTVRALEQLAAVRLTVERTRVKFKLAQNRPPETRRRIVRSAARAWPSGRRPGRRRRGVDAALHARGRPRTCRRAEPRKILGA